MKRYKIIFLLSFTAFMRQFIEIINMFGRHIVMQFDIEAASSLMSLINSMSYMFIAIIFFLVVALVSRKLYKGKIEIREILFYFGVILLIYTLPHAYGWVTNILNYGKYLDRHTNVTIYYHQIWSLVVIVIKMIIGLLCYLKGKAYYIEKEASDL